MENKLILKKEILNGRYLIVEELDHRGPVRTFIMSRDEVVIEDDEEISQKDVQSE